MSDTVERLPGEYVPLPDRDPNWCGLKDDPTFVQCCCNCIHLKPVHFHCSTEPKPPAELHEGRCCCPVQKGWACCVPEFETITDNWPQHSCGCELYEPKIKHEDHPTRQMVTVARNLAVIAKHRPRIAEDGSHYISKERIK